MKKRGPKMPEKKKRLETVRPSMIILFFNICIKLIILGRYIIYSKHFKSVGNLVY